MNTLSWLIYAASVSGGLRAVLIAIAAVFILYLFCCAIVLAASEGDVDTRPTIKKWVFVPVFCALLAAVMPSSSTIYMIAASEAGEAIVASPDAQEIMGDLKAIIKKKLKEQLAE